MGDDGFQVVSRKKDKKPDVKPPTSEGKPPISGNVKPKPLREVTTSYTSNVKDKNIKPVNPLPQKNAVINEALRKCTTDIKTGKKSYYCAFFPLRQGCTKGVACPFLHEVPEADKRDPAKIVRFPTDCVYQDKMGLCHDGAYCPFVHRVSDDVIADKKPSTPVCPPAVPKPGLAKPAGSPGGKGKKPSTSVSVASTTSGPSVASPSTAGSLSPLGAPGGRVPVERPPAAAAYPSKPSAWSGKSVWADPAPSRAPPPPGPPPAPALLIEEPPPPPPGLAAPEPLAPEPEPAVGALIDFDAAFTIDTVPVADGYLAAKKGHRVRVMYEEPGWYYGETPAGEGGWFAKANVARV